MGLHMPARTLASLGDAHQLALVLWFSVRQDELRKQGINDDEEQRLLSNLRVKVSGSAGRPAAAAAAGGAAGPAKVAPRCGMCGHCRQHGGAM